MENRSLVKALSPIDALGSSPHPLTAAQLSTTLKITRPTVCRILETLAEHGFVSHEEEGPFYRLSFKMLDLGQRVLERTDLVETARPILRRLSERFRESAHLAVSEDGRMVYLDKLEGSGPFCTHSRLGRSVPIYCTALGKAVLAFLPPAKARVILIRHGMIRHTPRTVVALPAMERELARIRRQGYAIDDVEFEEGVRCIGRRSSTIAASPSRPSASVRPSPACHSTGRMRWDPLCAMWSRASPARWDGDPAPSGSQGPWLL